MLTLFALVVMRMSGAIALNPMFARTNFPARARACLIVALSLLLYQMTEQSMVRTPRSMTEFVVMLFGELLLGVTLAFAMELAFMVVRYAAAVMDYCMGLSMAQIYDPQFGTQATVNSGLYYAFMALVFFATDGHLRLISIFYESARVVPFGGVRLDPAVMTVMTDAFVQAVVMGLQFALPLIAMELLAEAAMGILMRVVPQINVFTVNFQVKIVFGLCIMLLLFTPMADRMNTIFDRMYETMRQLLPLLGNAG